MAREHVPSGRVGGLAVPSGLGGVLLAACAGAIYQLALVVNPYGIANPVLCIIAAVFGIGFIVVWTLRLGKVRSRGWGFVIAMAVLAAFEISAFAVLSRVVLLNGAGGQGVSRRLELGVSLLGGASSVKGWMLATAWALEGLCVFLAALFVSIVEPGRPFCEHCVSWARKERWRCTIAAPAKEVLAEIQSRRRLDGVLAIAPGGGEGRLRVCVTSCTCARVAALVLVQLKKNKEGKEDSTGLIDDIVLTPRGLERLFSWGESVSPQLVGRRPDIEVRRDPVPLDRPQRPEAAEYRASFRWSGGTVGATIYSADNEFTRALRERLGRGDFEIAAQALADAGCGDDRMVIAEACADWMDRPGFLDDWAEEAPSDPRMLLVRGIWGCKWAWRARGVAWKPKDPRAFFERMQSADADLGAAAEGDPDDPCPWAWRLIASFALRPNPEAVRAIFKEADARSQGLHGACAAMGRYLSWKWYGSSSEALEFARAALASSPKGMYGGAVVAETHIDAWSERVRKKDSSHATYWTQPEVARDLRAASERCFRGNPDGANMARGMAREGLAFAMWKAGLNTDAAEHLRQMGTSGEWGFFSKNVPFAKETVKRARRDCRVDP